MRPISLLLLAALFCGAARPAGAQAPSAPPCDSVPGYHRLDFWLGEWDVFVGTTVVGRNRIEKVLNGCAVTELWTDARGAEGRSLFYFDPADESWNQVWVTGRSTAPGGLKLKRLTEVLAGGALRFQGTVTPVGGRAYLDRTTLTPLPGGHVRQVIETSGDGGQTWVVRFDAEYRHRRG